PTATAAVQAAAPVATPPTTALPERPVVGVKAGRPPLSFRFVLGAGVVAACLLLAVLIVSVIWIGGILAGLQQGSGQASGDPGPGRREENKDQPKKDSGKKPEVPQSRLFPKDQRRFLSDLEELEVVRGEWPVKVGDIGDGQPIKVAGKLSPHG